MKVQAEIDTLTKTRQSGYYNYVWDDRPKLVVTNDEVDDWVVYLRYLDTTIMVRRNDLLAAVSKV